MIVVFKENKKLSAKKKPLVLIQRLFYNFQFNYSSPKTSISFIALMRSVNLPLNLVALTM